MTGGSSPIFYETVKFEDRVNPHDPVPAIPTDEYAGGAGSFDEPIPFNFISANPSKGGRKWQMDQRSARHW
jgi:hypothetical protein